MTFKPVRFQQWLTRNRLWLWWVLYIPLVGCVLYLNRKHLNIPVADLKNLILSPQYKIFNSALVIVLGRIVAVAVGIVIIMVCLLFPYFRVSKEGVQWTKEFEDELTEASGELAGEEISRLVKEESFRWSLIYGWLKMEEREILEPHFILRELLATIWEAFPDRKISLTLIHEGERWGIHHPLLAKLVVAENNNMSGDDGTFGLKLQFKENTQVLLHIYSEADGFSQIDEQFILVLGKVFLILVMTQDYSPVELFSFFDKIPLTFERT